MKMQRAVGREFIEEICSWESVSNRHNSSLHDFAHFPKDD